MKDIDTVIFPGYTGSGVVKLTPQEQTDRLPWMAKLFHAPPVTGAYLSSSPVSNAKVPLKYDYNNLQEIRFFIISALNGKPSSETLYLLEHPETAKWGSTFGPQKFYELYAYLSFDLYRPLGESSNKIKRIVDVAVWSALGLKKDSEKGKFLTDFYRFADESIEDTRGKIRNAKELIMQLQQLPDQMALLASFYDLSLGLFNETQEFGQRIGGDIKFGVGDEHELYHQTFILQQLKLPPLLEKVHQCNQYKKRIANYLGNSYYLLTKESRTKQDIDHVKLNYRVIINLASYKEGADLFIDYLAKLSRKRINLSLADPAILKALALELNAIEAQGFPGIPAIRKAVKLQGYPVSETVSNPIGTVGMDGEPKASSPVGFDYLPPEKELLIRLRQSRSAIEISGIMKELVNMVDDDEKIYLLLQHKLFLRALNEAMFQTRILAQDKSNSGWYNACLEEVDANARYILIRVFTNPAYADLLSRTFKFQNTKFHDATISFADAQTHEFMNREFWQLINIIKDADKTADLILFLSMLRYVYYSPFLPNQGTDAPLEFAIKNGIYVPLTQHLYIAPLSESFRRHILFRMDYDRVDSAVELFIPGERWMYRDLYGAQRFDVSQQIRGLFGEDNGVVKTLLMAEYPAGIETEAYGERGVYRQDAPLLFFVYDYSKHLDGRRLLYGPYIDANFSLDYLKHVGIFDIDYFVKDILRIINRFIIAGYYFQDGCAKGKGKGKKGKDLHLGNFRVCRDARVRFVGDFDQFYREFSASTNLRNLSNFELWNDIKAQILEFIGQLAGNEQFNEGWIEKLAIQVMREEKDDQKNRCRSSSPARGSIFRADVGSIIDNIKSRINEPGREVKIEGELKPLYTQLIARKLNDKEFIGLLRRGLGDLGALARSKDDTVVEDFTYFLLRELKNISSRVSRAKKIKTILDKLDFYNQAAEIIDSISKGFEVLSAKEIKVFLKDLNALIEAAKEENVVYATLKHYLANPLSAVAMILVDLREGLDAPLIQDDIDLVKEALSRCANVVNYLKRTKKYRYVNYEIGSHSGDKIILIPNTALNDNKVGQNARSSSPVKEALCDIDRNILGLSGTIKEQEAYFKYVFNDEKRGYQAKRQVVVKTELMKFIDEVFKKAVSYPGYRENTRIVFLRAGADPLFAMAKVIAKAVEGLFPLERIHSIWATMGNYKAILQDPNQAIYFVKYLYDQGILAQDTSNILFVDTDTGVGTSTGTEALIFSTLIDKNVISKANAEFGLNLRHWDSSGNYEGNAEMFYIVRGHEYSPEAIASDVSFLKVGDFYSVGMTESHFYNCDYFMRLMKLVMPIDAMPKLESVGGRLKLGLDNKVIQAAQPPYNQSFSGSQQVINYYLQYAGLTAGTLAVLSERGLDVRKMACTYVEDLRKQLSEYASSSSPAGTEGRNSYPFAGPVSKEAGRLPFSEQKSEIVKLLGTSVNDMEFSIVISPPLERQIEVRSIGCKQYLFVNPNILRGPPSEHLETIFSVYVSFLLQGKTKIEAQKLFISSLINNNLLFRHIQFLENNSLGLIADQEWLSKLKQEHESLYDTIIALVRMRHRGSVYDIEDILSRIIQYIDLLVCDSGKSLSNNLRQAFKEFYLLAEQSRKDVIDLIYAPQPGPKIMAEEMAISGWRKELYNFANIFNELKEEFARLQHQIPYLALGQIGVECKSSSMVISREFKELVFILREGVDL
ncbi:MAG: hypothetical protein WC561_05955, partial [Candidatus Omnitrophota bacterium]